DAPVANNVSDSTSQNTAVTVTLSGSDVEGSALSYAIDAGPGHGTLGELDGQTVTYYPAGNFHGTDTFTYWANDGILSGASATVTVTAPDDSIVQGDHNVTITHAATSADAAYNGISVAGLSVAVTDIDFVGIFADPGANSTDLNEQGPTGAAFPISLDSKPSA